MRGWGTLLVGPKLPQVQLEQSGDSTVAIADRYTPVGGLARLVGSVELHFPMPVLSEPFQPYVFYDGGRIWTPDQPLRAQRGRDRRGQVLPGGRGGHRLQTVVGAIQVAVGYKLNPSPLDLRSPAGRADALTERHAHRGRADLVLAAVPSPLLDRRDVLTGPPHRDHRHRTTRPGRPTLTAAGRIFLLSPAHSAASGRSSSWAAAGDSRWPSGCGAASRSPSPRPSPF